jgi:hypothetical protein
MNINSLKRNWSFVSDIATHLGIIIQLVSTCHFEQSELEDPEEGLGDD